VRIYLNNPDGREVTIRVYEPGTVFGEFSVLDGKPRSTAVDVFEDATMLVLYREDFMDLLQNNFDLVQRLIVMLVERLRYTTRHFEQLALLNAEGRLAAHLLQLTSLDAYDPTSLEADNRNSARLKMTQQDLASLIGASREWVNKALGDFELAGLIRIERGAVIVLDRTGLERCIKL
jgi:CRP/FNR family transcriptional regulator, cyclic AMP receptor protein